MTEVSTNATFSLTPQNMDEAERMANMMAASQMVPKDYQGKPANVLVAVQMGLELGLKPVQSLQNIAVVNGRPAIWGDGMRALVVSAPDLGSISENLDDKTMTATCIIARKINGKEVKFVGKFSQEDATLAGLWGQNTWKKYPKRMLQWRAFGFAARDAYADRLKGIQLAEEIMDIDKNSPKDMGTVSALPDYPQDKFNDNFPLWQAAITDGKQDADTIINTISSKFTLSNKQILAIKEVA